MTVVEDVNRFPSFFPCHKCVNFTISSVGGYIKEMVPDAANVWWIEVLEESPSSACVYRETYGFYGPAMYVDRCCAAVFRVCYLKGTVEVLAYNSKNNKRRRCVANCVIKSASIKKQTSKSPCVERFSFRPNGQVLEVSKGCRAIFYLGCEANECP